MGDLDEKPKLIVSGEALSLIDSWLGVSSGTEIPAIMPDMRPKGVGLGAQFLSHNDQQRNNPERAIKGSLKRKSALNEDEEIDSREKVAVNSDDEETQRGGHKICFTSTNGLSYTHKHAHKKNRVLSGLSVLEADLALKQSQRKKKKKKKKCGAGGNGTPS
eukprot:CFRG0678T1